MDETSVPITNAIHDDHSITCETSKVNIQMQWFFLGLVTLWIIAAMLLPFVALYLTKNPIFLSGFTTLAPPVYILYRIARYLFPRCDSDYQIELEKIKARSVSHKQHNNHSLGPRKFFNPLKNANWPGQ